MEAHEARVNVTYQGQNGDLPDPVNYDAPDVDVRRWVTEAVRTGGVPGIPADPNADFTDFVVDKFTANEARPYNAIMIRPKTPFGPVVLGSLPRLSAETVKALSEEEAWYEEVYGDDL